MIFKKGCTAALPVLQEARMPGSYWSPPSHLMTYLSLRRDICYQDINVEIKMKN